ncbi:von willebrand type a domain containing protein [Phaffia rhodozyma]|uniref:von willebrand type a domain containing protein n=1 Tax=Phaffia rhodozyma TaxID=264483 RepID=A0A0F7SVX7_PHARH|nr:von willebrand type a domain containing protein [Phaffia rhodozyma]
MLRILPRHTHLRPPTLAMSFSNRPDEPIPRIKIYPQPRKHIYPKVVPVQPQPSSASTLPPAPPSDKPALFDLPNEKKPVGPRNQKTANRAFAVVFGSLLMAYAYEKSAEYGLFGPADKESYRERMKTHKQERSLQRRQEEYVNLQSKFAAKLAASAVQSMVNPQQGATGGYGQQPSYGQQQQQQQYQQTAYGQQSYGQPASSQYGGQPQQAYGQPAQNQGSAQSFYNQQPSSQPGAGQYGQSQQHGAQYAQSGQQAGQYGQTGQQYGQTGQSYGQPNQQYGQQGGQYGSYSQPTSGQYGQSYNQSAPPMPSNYGSNGGYPPHPASGGSGQIDPNHLAQVLQQCIGDQKLHAFYPQGATSQIAQRIAHAGVLDRLIAEWRIPKEIAFDLAKLALFDVAILVDDSGSMAFEENGERIVELKLILQKIAFATGLFDQDGVSVRFLNSPVEGNNISNDQQVMGLVAQVQFSGLTPLGTSLDQKVLQPMVLGPARNGSLRKPMLIISITDGTPAGEAQDCIFKVITQASQQLQQSRYGPDAVSFMFAQVGNDLKARDWLATLDASPVVGGLVDVCSNYESEADEMKRKTGVDLSPELWLVKLLLGAIDTNYDSKDESRF